LIGRITPDKRLSGFLKPLRMPAVPFDIVGTPNRQSDYATRLPEAAARVLTSRTAGFRQPASLSLSASALLCCTSRLEAFPQFPRAWPGDPCCYYL
jgi:hypothetical protein